MSVKLKPCPFCGGEAWVIGATESDGQEGFIARCNDFMCIGYGSAALYTTKEVAAEFWNRRAHE